MAAPFITKMKNLVITRYQTKEREGKSEERWAVSMYYPNWFNTFDAHLASLPTEQVEKAGFSLDAEVIKERGCPAEQAIAMQLNTYLTGKISSAKMADKSEAEILDYCSKNFIKIASEAKSQAEKISAAVNNEQEWFTAKAKEMADLFVKGETEKALAVQAEMEARKKPTV